jgi:hypothetical protein
MGADRRERGAAQVERHRADAAKGHLHGDGAGRGRRLGHAAREVRQAADVGPDGAGDFLRRQRLPGVGIIADAWGHAHDFLAAEKNSAQTFLPNGRAPKAGKSSRIPISPARFA